MFNQETYNFTYNLSKTEIPASMRRAKHDSRQAVTPCRPRAIFINWQMPSRGCIVWEAMVGEAVVCDAMCQIAKGVGLETDACAYTQTCYWKWAPI